MPCRCSRPRLGYGSDVSGRATPWIIGGMAVLALGGAAGRGRDGLDGGAASWPAWRSAVAGLPADRHRRRRGRHLAAGPAGQAGRRTSRRAAAATIVWLMMIAGFVVTAGGRGHPARPVLADAAGGGQRRRLGRGVPRHAARGLGRRARRAGRRQRRPRRPPGAVPRGAGPGLGGAARRGGSPSSSSSRCWPTARRT